MCDSVEAAFVFGISRLCRHLCYRSNCSSTRECMIYLFLRAYIYDILLPVIFSIICVMPTGVIHEHIIYSTVLTTEDDNIST